MVVNRQQRSHRPSLQALGLKMNSVIFVALGLFSCGVASGYFLKDRLSAKEKNYLRRMTDQFEEQAVHERELAKYWFDKYSEEKKNRSRPLNFKWTSITEELPEVNGQYYVNVEMIIPINGENHLFNEVMIADWQNKRFNLVVCRGRITHWALVPMPEPLNKTEK